MAEWSNAPVLKTGVLNGTGGSNPSLSANKRTGWSLNQFFCLQGPRDERLGIDEVNSSHNRNQFLPYLLLSLNHSRYAVSWPLIRRFNRLDTPFRCCPYGILKHKNKAITRCFLFAEFPASLLESLRLACQENAFCCPLPNRHPLLTEPLRRTPRL